MLGCALFDEGQEQQPRLAAGGQKHDEGLEQLAAAGQQSPSIWTNSLCHMLRRESVFLLLPKLDERQKIDQQEWTDGNSCNHIHTMC